MAVGNLLTFLTVFFAGYKINVETSIKPRVQALNFIASKIPMLLKYTRKRNHTIKITVINLLIGPTYCLICEIFSSLFISAGHLTDPSELCNFHFSFHYYPI